jgi:hypothetical protein
MSKIKRDRLKGTLVELQDLLLKMREASFTAGRVRCPGSC